MTPIYCGSFKGSSGRPSTTFQWLWQALAGLALLSGVAFSAEPISKEYQLKAAFLYNFTRFVEWNAPSLQSSETPILIGVLGANPFGDELENAVRDRKVNGRAIAVKRVPSIAAARGVHLLFVGASEDARLGELRETLRGAGVLTIGESEAFAKAGGVITFVIEGDKVRFDINTAAADTAAIKISAQLQKLARTVRK